MTYYDFIITYKSFDAFGNIVKEGTIKAKRKATEFEAMAGTEKYLQKKYTDIKKIQVIECKKANWLEDLFGQVFGDAFKP